MSRHRIVVSVDIPDNPGLTNEDLASYLLDAASTWYGQLHPNSDYWALSEATWRAGFTQDGEETSMENGPADD